MSESLSATVPAFCRPNIGKAGRRRRTIVGSVIAVVALALLVWFIAVHAPWSARLTLFLPVSGAAVTLLQVRRRT